MFRGKPEKPKPNYRYTPPEKKEYVSDDYFSYDFTDKNVRVVIRGREGRVSFQSWEPSIHGYSPRAYAYERNPLSASEFREVLDKYYEVKQEYPE
jgi:hypothetical protein